MEVPHFVVVIVDVSRAGKVFPQIWANQWMEGSIIIVILQWVAKLRAGEPYMIGRGLG